MNMKVANTMEIRLQNAFYIMNEIECNPGITNTVIAQKRGLSLPTISNIVNILKNSELVMTTGTGESSGGRRPIQLSLNPQCRYSIGVSIARHTVYILLIDFEGHIYEKEKHFIQFEETREYWDKIESLVQKMQEKTTMSCGIGIALPGFVDLEQKIALDTYTLGTPTVSIELIEQTLGKHISIGDSCKLAAMAQVFTKNNIEDYFFVLLSRRVSGILFHNGSILELKGSSLDIGAMIIDSTNRDQTFGTGAPGSVLELCSASRIVEIIKKNYQLTSYEEFFGEIENGNLEFIQIWETYLRNLSIAIYNLYSFLKVDIVVGGEMAKYIEPYTQKVIEYINDLSPKNIQNLNLDCSIYGEYDDAYGAALDARFSYLQEKLPEILKNSAANIPAPAQKNKKKKSR